MSSTLPDRDTIELFDPLLGRLTDPDDDALEAKGITAESGFSIIANSRFLSLGSMGGSLASGLGTWPRTRSSEPQYPIWDQTLLLFSLREQIETLREQVATLTSALQDRPLVSSSQLFDLGDDRLRVQVPIPIILQETDTEALARWPEVRTSGTGPTLSEAIVDLKADIADLYLDMSGRDPVSLGLIARDILRLLQLHITAA